MAQEVINVGTTADDGTGEPIGRALFQKINSNFSELYPKADQLTFQPLSHRMVYGDGGQIADATAQACWIVGGEQPNRRNRIGVLNGLPSTVTPSVTMDNWTVDAGYTAGIFVCSVLGGYNTIVNATGSGAAFANHSMIKYSAEGHNSIIGGSTCVIAGGRSGLFNATQCEVDATGVYDFIAASRNSSTGGSYNSILSSQNSHNDGSQSAVIASNASTISSGATYGLVIGNGCQITAGAGTINVGTGNIASGGTVFVLGTTITASHAGVVAIGAEYSTVGNFTTHMGFRIRENNDCLSWKQTTGRRTTNSVATNTLWTVQLPTAKWSSGLLRISVTAQQDGSADGDATGDYAVAAYTGTIGYRWDGTNGYLYTDATTSGPTASPVMNLTTVRDDITLAAVPQLRLSTGLLRVAVTGHATKHVVFAIEVEAISTVVR
jgi:hypothetical protein